MKPRVARRSYGSEIAARTSRILPTVHEAKTHLSRLIQEALDGEEIVIARGNEPLVRLVLVESARPQRSLGWAKGQVTMAPDFDATLADLANYQRDQWPRVSR